MTFSHRSLAGGVWLALLCALVPGLAKAQEGADERPLKVFILAGQSNMQGHAQVRTLKGMADDPKTRSLFARLVDDEGEPRVWESVRVSSLGSADEERVGPLTAGFGSARGGPKIGPEVAFGATIQERLGERVLLIKTAWGGKSLHTDFRPPSAGSYEFNDAELKRFAKRGVDIDAERAAKREATGVYYRAMMSHVQTVLSDLQRVDPEYDEARGFELAGFAWFQGWNDLVDSSAYPDRGAPGGYDAYSDVLATFIRDVRRDLDAPKLPFAIGVLGVGGPTELYGPDQKRYQAVHQHFRDAMAAPASLPEFEGTVTAVLTEPFWDHRASELRTKRRAVNKPAGEAEGPGLTEEELQYLERNVSNAEYHYLGSAKILSQVGEALAEALLQAPSEGSAGNAPAGEKESAQDPERDDRDEQAVPDWIWLEEVESFSEVIFRKRFEVSAAGAKASIAGTCDNEMVILVNGERVGASGRWEDVVGCDVSSLLQQGENLLEVRTKNKGGAAGLAMRLAIDDQELGRRSIVTDESWEAAPSYRAVRDRWSQAASIGAVGADGLPWNEHVTLARFDAPQALVHPEDIGGPQPARPASELQLLSGFEAELLYSVPNEVYGSWVALAKDDRGRLYASDQHGKGLFRITPAGLPGSASDAPRVTSIEPVQVDISGAQGMCWAFDALYVNVYGQGVWRITDTDGDDHLDRLEHLIELGSGGEHGPHAILLTEDGEGLYFIGGNHVRPPAYDGSKAPDNWDEDQLLPRLWDVNGHAVGMMAPGGWIARCDPDGKNVTIVSGGYRNQYDIALNRAGELFTYDSDMEWDIGSPWYRPTRLCHVTSGSEFGWRSGTGKWPSYYEDSLPPVLEVGPGSPTGIVFGTGAAFPARYQDALFILDWTFGTIYALHLEPDGATYRATKEDFVWSKPLGVTDAVVGSDGALYFTVGGRGSQSALYRVRYTGSQSTAPAAAPPVVTEATALRRSLEQFHGAASPRALDAAWPSLSSSDRFVRFAARIAVENQPVETWRARALSEQDPQASVTALVALARQGSPEDLRFITAALGRLPHAELSAGEWLGALRAYALTFTRLGGENLDPGRAASIVAALEPHFPTVVGGADSRVAASINAELARVLTYLGSANVVPKAMALIQKSRAELLPEWAQLIQRNDTYGGPIAAMLADMPPVRGLGLALILKDATEGWTPELRAEYFKFFVEASQHAGGWSYAGFLEKIRDEAAKHLTVAEERVLAPLLGQSLFAPLPEDITPPEGPGQTWTLEAAMAALAPPLRNQSFERGRNLFHAASCSTCHRMGGVGGAIGPDLTTVANKYAISDILEAIVEPSKIISDQYGSHIIVDTDGIAHEGILVEDGEETVLYPRDPGAEPLYYDRSDIEQIKESSTSQMPAGLVDPLSAAELRDLIAYLVAAGHRKDALFGAD